MTLETLRNLLSQRAFIPDDGIPAEFKICSLLHVTAIEPLAGASR